MAMEGWDDFFDGLKGFAATIQSDVDRLDASLKSDAIAGQHGHCELHLHICLHSRLLA